MPILLEDGDVTAQRIQRKRTKGWRMPEGAVYVGRPSYWGNPFYVGDRVGDVLIFRLAGQDPLWQWGDLGRFDDDHKLTREEAVAAFRSWIHRSVGTSGFARTYETLCELKGKDLACWCPLDQPCHADVLLQYANGSAS